MAQRILSYLAIFAFLSFFLSASAFAPAPQRSYTTQPHEAFLQCFQEASKDAQIVYMPGTKSYQDIFNSSVRNLRTLDIANATKPTLIITPEKFSDVKAAVICGKAHGLRLRVLSGGHDYEGLSYLSLGVPFVTVDLDQLRSIKISKDGDHAWVEAGATIGELYYAVSRMNTSKAFPGSVCTTIGVGGLFSGGGIGMMMRKHGVSADNVIDATIVDVNGQLLNRESMGEELFWAIRGGGAVSFGVILAYKVKLVDVPPKVTVFRATRTLSRNAKELVLQWQHVAPHFDDNLFIRVLVHAADPDPAKGSGNRTIQATFECLYLGGQHALLADLANSFPALGVKAEDLTELTWAQSVLFFAGYSTQNTTVLKDRMPLGESYFKAKSDFVKEPISEVQLEKIWKYLMDGVDQYLTMIMDPWGGKLSEISEEAIAFPHRKGNLFNIQHWMWWPETENDAEKHLDWFRQFYDYIAPVVSKNPRAAYLNYRDLDLGRNREGTTYQEAGAWESRYFLGNYERLAKVKAAVDPENFFWNEQSILPFPA